MTDMLWPELDGRRYVVTGAGSGMGLATLRMLVGSGASVVGATRSDRGLAAIEEAGGEPLRCDVTLPQDRARLDEAAGEAHGISMSHGRTDGQALEEVDEEAFDGQVDANLKSVFFLLQAFAPRLPEGGAAVVVSSWANKRGNIPEVAVYGAAKAGVDQLVRNFAWAYGPRGVRVNAIVPGIVDTAMQRTFLELNAPLHGLTPEQFHAQRVAAVPLRRSAAPEEAAALIVFLLSPRSSYVTGQCINFSGGFVTW
jgi:NAD(P)-dependent dehydrogenase (short-subunit alcohol dehydrogenase family)